MSDIVRCDICGKTADSHNATNGFCKLSFDIDENGSLKRVNIDLCWEDTQNMVKTIVDWIEKEKLKGKF